jgi:hypothetical protein
MPARVPPFLIGMSLLAGCSSGPLEHGALMAISAPSGDLLVPVKSIEDRKFATVVRQKYDFSCGSAALATLLRHHYRVDQDEEAAFRGMWAAGDREQIRRVGFSLLDMKRHLTKLGFQADGFEVTLAEVSGAGVPGIALINLNGYKHFVVVKGVSATEVLVGDPALGLKTMPVADFEKAWNGIYFAINNNPERGRSSFNRDAQWANFARAPIGAGFADPVSQQALMLTAPFYRDF